MSLPQIVLAFWMLLSLSVSSSVSAHALPESRIMLNIGSHQVNANIVIPFKALKIVSPDLLASDAQQITATDLAKLAVFFQQHLRPQTIAGQPWQVDLQQAQINHHESQTELETHLVLTPPENAPVDHLILQYDAIGHRLVTHKTAVYLTGNWRTGWVNDEQQPRLLGILRYNHRSIAVNEATGSVLHGLVKMAEWGAHHVLEGADHMLFLLSLLVASPLLIRQRRWASARPISESLGVIAKMVSFFTLGHSITLILSTLLWSQGESQLIETLIALTLLITAFHLIHPIMRSREYWLAGGFGLIHGLAFASTLEGIMHDPLTLTLSTFAFNIGIEAAQLGVILLVIPGLLILARTRFYHYFRWFAGMTGIIAAICWGLERSTGFESALLKQMNNLIDQQFILYGYLLFLCVTLALLPIAIRNHQPLSPLRSGL